LLGVGSVDETTTEASQLRKRRRDSGPAVADPDQWRVALRIAGHAHRAGDPWSTPEIILAIRAWTTAHGRAPYFRSWRFASPQNPSNTTVVNRFGNWRTALAAAGFDLAPVTRHRYYRDGRYAKTPA
jgi:hypothetical protein